MHYRTGLQFNISQSKKELFGATYTESTAAFLSQNLPKPIADKNLESITILTVRQPCFVWFRL